MLIKMNKTKDMSILDFPNYNYIIFFAFFFHEYNIIDEEAVIPKVITE